MIVKYAAIKYANGQLKSDLLSVISCSYRFYRVIHWVNTELERCVNFELAGRIAIVTGGSRGIGASIASMLAAQGVAVSICARTAPDALPAGISFDAVDVRDPDAVQAYVDAVAARHGRLDILVNNAGGSPESDAATASPRFAEAITRLNLLAPYYIARAAHPHLKASGKGAIVNIASVSGIRPSPGTAIYGAAKAGLLSLTKSLAAEWGPDAIRVNAIIVGLAETEGSASTYGDAAAHARIARSLPLGRMTRGDDVARAVLYLASDAAEYVSGAQLNADGGGERPLFLDLIKGE